MWNRSRFPIPFPLLSYSCSKICMSMDNRNCSYDSNDMISNNNSSSTCCIAPLSSSEPLSSEIPALALLSRNLESVLDSSDSDSFYSDANIALACGREVSVHRCILAARSPFFNSLFACSKEKGTKLELKELAKEYEIGYYSLVAVLAYLYTGRARPFPKDTCVCVDDECSHVACRPAVDFMVEVLYAAFAFQVPELLALYQRHLLDNLHKVATDDILVVLVVSNICGDVCERLVSSCLNILVKSDVDVVTLDKALPEHIVKRIIETRVGLKLDKPENISFPGKHIKRIHRALDSDDVELVRMLLKEGHTTLDDAHALHYAVAYCDAKTTTELLDIGVADVNQRNSRGYSVLHVAAMRKEPKIIVSLLTKGARPSDLTPDGRTALQISKQLTRAIFYYKYTEKEKTLSNDRLCVEILEQAERREPLLGEASHSLAIAGDDLRTKLLYLENRVSLARLLFPAEAQVVMDIAHVDETSEFTLASMNSDRLAGAKRRTVDLNDAPFRIKEEYLNRMRALSRTVELGKRFFPRCSAVLNTIMDADDLSQLASLGSGTPDERHLKKQRFSQLQEMLNKAFDEDKEEFDRSGIPSSSSSKPVGIRKPNGKFNRLGLA